ncbi:lipase family protein [Streptomyces rubradiris]|uniref:Triacylglycerol lipase n=1 Tax=Streptomyces rubradiris TaxID=285531 RepID=A0ABQ3RD49_STRRR|nr:lipase family protein [Streptomyces rubradiris]GHG94958.1 hypothetical protein GCM10018792_05340 [Streptomyces rubradiris]GHI53796.1 hypothetical protein Srubr_36420 [Streptomyces rubradiris]
MKSLVRKLTARALPLALAAAGIAALPATAGAAAVAAPAHGTLLTSAPAAVKLGTGAPAVNAWHISYASTDSRGGANTVTGTVLVPATAWSGGSARPLVAYAPGTHGLASRCAPSAQLAAGTDYETANIVALLKKNWAVVVTDYAGYGAGQTPTYLAGRSQGQAVLDSALAAFQVPGSGLSGSAMTAVWGYSQGGQSAGWAGQLEPSYASSLNLAGVVAGGVPGDFKASARYLNGSTGASFLLQGVVGLAAEYPDKIPFDELVNDAGRAAVADAKDKCVFETLFDYINDDIKQYTADGRTLDELMAIGSVGEVLGEQDLGGAKIQAPVYQYHGQADEILPLDQAISLKKRYCSRGTAVKFDVYPSEHIATQFQAAPNVTKWLTDRFDGKPQLVGDCLNILPPPRSTANPGGGDFVVSLDKWLLKGGLQLKTLGETVLMPEGSTFTADTDLTARRLDGSLAVPTFLEHLRVIGLPVQARIGLKSEGTSGTVSLDDAGRLAIHGKALATVEIVSAGELGVHIPLGCRTAEPVEFALDFEGPVAALGSGGLTFSGTTAFPSLTDCGLFGPALSLAFSGPGNGYTFTVVPPAPKSY